MTVVTAAGRRTTPLVIAGAALGLAYAVGGTWSIGRTFGGVTADGGWVDASGAPTSIAPPQVQVTGHPAPWVVVVLTAILVVGGIWASRAAEGRARRRTLATVAVAALFVVAVIAVFTGLQMHLVDQAFANGSTHPPILGNATIAVRTLHR